MKVRGMFYRWNNAIEIVRILLIKFNKKIKQNEQERERWDFT